MTSQPPFFSTHIFFLFTIWFMDFAGEITFKELCKKVKRALAQTREREWERDEVNRKVTRLHKKKFPSMNKKTCFRCLSLRGSSNFHDHGRNLSDNLTRSIKCELFFFNSPTLLVRKRTTREGEGGEILCFFFVLPHHLTLTFRIKILPWISTYSRRRKKKVQNETTTKEGKKWEINQTTNTFKVSPRSRAWKESRVLMYCEILTKAKRSMNYTNWPTSSKNGRARERGRESVEASRKLQ